MRRPVILAYSMIRIEVLITAYSDFLAVNMLYKVDKTL